MFCMHVHNIFGKVTSHILLLESIRRTVLVAVMQPNHLSCWSCTRAGGVMTAEVSAAPQQSRCVKQQSQEQNETLLIVYVIQNWYAYGLSHHFYCAWVKCDFIKDKCVATDQQ